MTYAKGIDLSKWQASTPNLSGFDFVIARASIGTSMDTRYAQHIGKAKALGLVTGAYHFNWDDEAKVSGQPVEQARYFVDHAGDVDLLFLDVEGAMAFEESEARAFIAEVHRLGKRCGLYMSAGAYEWGVGADYDWVAKWGDTAPRGDWEFWQYTSDGHVAGYDGRLDLNYFNGTRDQLRALSNRSHPMPFYVASPVSGSFTIPAGKEVRFLKPGLDGWSIAKTRTAQTTVSRPLKVIRKASEMNGQSPTPVLQIDPADSYAGGLWVATSSVDEVINPVVDTSPYTQAQLDAAVAAQAAANDAEVAALKAQLDSAAQAERERIAQAEAARIAGI